MRPWARFSSASSEARNPERRLGRSWCRECVQLCRVIRDQQTPLSLCGFFRIPQDADSIPAASGERDLEVADFLDREPGVFLDKPADLVAGFCVVECEPAHVSTRLVPNNEKAPATVPHYVLKNSNFTFQSMFKFPRRCPFGWPDGPVQARHQRMVSKLHGIADRLDRLA